MAQINLNKNIIGLRIRRNKDNILAMYDKGDTLQVIADEYNVVVSTIHIHLRSWGVKVKRNIYRRRVKGANKYKRKFSKEFLANRAEMTARYGHKIKYFKREDTKSEVDRICSVTKQKVTVI